MSNSIRISSLDNLPIIRSVDFIPIVQSGSSALLTTYRTPISAFNDFIAVSGSVISSSFSSASLSASHAILSDNSFTSVSSSYAGFAEDSYFTTLAGFADSSQFSYTSSFLDYAGFPNGTSSYSLTSSYSQISSTSSFSLLAKTASYFNFTVGIPPLASSSLSSISSSFASSSISSSYSKTSSFSVTSSYAVSASFVSGLSNGPKFVGANIFASTNTYGTFNYNAISYGVPAGATSIILYANVSYVGDGGTGEAYINSYPWFNWGSSGNSHAFITSHQGVFPLQPNGAFQFVLTNVSAIINAYVVGYYK
jgi:hypothetical protein